MQKNYRKEKTGIGNEAQTIYPAFYLPYQTLFLIYVTCSSVKAMLKVQISL